MSQPVIAGGHTPSSEPEEASLVARLRAGEEGAYEELLVRYGGRMLAVSRRILGNDEDARDALQEAFLLAFRAIDRFEGQSKVSTWLHRIVVNASLMKIRSRKSRPEESIEPLLPEFQEDGHAVHPAVEWRESAEQLVLRRQVRERVRAAIERLPESYRTVMILRDIEELDTAAVAGMLGITENAVKIRLHRARQALRELIDPCIRGELA